LSSNKKKASFVSQEPSGADIADISTPI